MAVVRVATRVDRVLADAADRLWPPKCRRAMPRRVGDVLICAAVDAGVGVVEPADAAARHSPVLGLWSMHLGFFHRVGVVERRTAK